MSHVVIAVIFLVALTLSVLALLVLTRDGAKSSRSRPTWSAAYLHTPPRRAPATKAEPAAASRERTATAPRPERARPTSVPGMGHLPDKRIVREARTLVQEIEQYLDEQSRLT
jgi:hypothetical protein